MFCLFANLSFLFQCSEAAAPAATSQPQLIPGTSQADDNQLPDLRPDLNIVIEPQPDHQTPVELGILDALERDAFAEGRAAAAAAGLAPPPRRVRGRAAQAQAQAPSRGRNHAGGSPGDEGD